MDLCNYKALVSIIVPVYNAESYIKDTMDMLCQSSLNEIEIIAVNDGSTDNSLSVLKACAEADSRIKVVDKPNGGIFDARNRGMSEASGEYISFCDQDDIVEPQMYETMYKTAKENLCEIAMCSVGRNLDGKKVPYYVYKKAIQESPEIQEDSFLSLVFVRSTIFKSNNNTQFLNSIWNCLVSRRFIEDNCLHFRRYVNFEDDRLFVLDMLARAKRIVFVPEIFYYWTVNLKSESHSLRYIEDFYNKDIMYQNAVVDIMKTAECSKEYINLFENFNSAYRYARLVENEANHTGVRKNKRLKIIKAIYNEPKFSEGISAAKYYSKNMVAMRIVCLFLEKRGVACAYDFWKIYSWIRRKCQNKVFWTKFEKKAMGENM